MFRVSIQKLPRACGPLGLTPNGKVLTTKFAHRPEYAMAAMNCKKTLWSNQNEFIRRNGITARLGLWAIPRDFGEIPRNFLLRILFANQPIGSAELWERLKERTDCPYDSQTHMREVLRFARKQNWVYAEKNQANNKWYWHVHRRRMSEVQSLLDHDRVHERDEELAKPQREMALQKEQELNQEEALDKSIVLLQQQLVASVCKLREFNPAAAAELPCSTGDGGVDVAWHWKTSGSVAAA